MENQPVKTNMDFQSSDNSYQENSGFYSPKNVVIIVLSVLLIFSFLGINL